MRDGEIKGCGLIKPEGKHSIGRSRRYLLEAMVFNLDIEDWAEFECGIMKKGAR
jgi:hypothetical protein